MPSAFEHGPTLTVVASPTANAGVIWSAANNLGQSTVLLGTGTLGISGDTDIITLTANTVTVAGTVAATTLTGNGAGVTALAAANITASGTLPALNGAALTALNGTQITSGTLPAARIGDDSIVEGKLNVSNGPTNGHVLTARDGVAGGFTWEAAASGGAADDYFASSGLSSKDQGTGLHIKTGDSGGTASSAGNEFIIEGGSGNHGMSILGSGDGGSYIYLGDGAAPSRAGMSYSHGDDKLVFRSGDNTRMEIAAAGEVKVQENNSMPSVTKGIAKAWGNFDGASGTPSYRISYNMGTLDDDGAGNYGCHFSTAMEDDGYVIAGTSVGDATMIVRNVGNALAEGEAKIAVMSHNGGLVDRAFVTIVVFGEQT